MQTSETQIQCPECGNHIDVNNILKHQLEETLRKEFQSKFNEERNGLKAKLAKLQEERETFDEQLKKATKDAEKVLRERLQKEMEEEQGERLKMLTEELEVKSERLKQLNKAQAEIERLKREKDEMRSEIELESQKKLNDELSKAREFAKKKADEENELKVKELQKQLEDQKKLTEEMKRKQEQGSMQLQGEVQELAMEEWLQQTFPLDTIDEIKKGANGADCIQIVNTRERQNCGTIYYESKRTKHFQPVWIEKFRNDIRELNADLGVLVTEVLPSDMDRMGMRDGIWICTYEEFKGLSAVLRQSVINVSLALASQENKGDKMVMLYDYLTSTEFRLQVEGIVEGFSQMKTDLDREKNAMKRIWKQREKQLDKVISNTTGMYGAIRGIAGSGIKAIPALELPSGEEELDD